MLSRLGSIFIFFISINAFGQKDFTILYETKPLDSTNSGFRYPGLTVVIHDSVSYCYYPEVAARLKKLKENLPLGSASMPKSQFMNTNGCYYLFQVGDYDKPKKLRLVEGPCAKGFWTFTGEIKSIVGYTCKKATGLLNGRNVVAWYSTDLPVGFGPFITHDLPGTVLQYWYPDGGFITTAIIINKGGFAIVEPNYCKRISRAEYDRSQR